MCLFWGGLPHQMDARSDDAIYAGAHLPLVHFFRLHLPSDVPRRLMMGATLVTAATDAADHHNFERWNRYWRSGDPAKTQHAVNELLLRLERMRFEPYRLVPEDAGAGDRQPVRPAVVAQCRAHVRLHRREFPRRHRFASTSPPPPTSIRNTP